MGVYLAYSLKGYLITLQAKYFFVTHGILDMNQFGSRNGVMVNLTHCTYPIKEMLRLPRCLSAFTKMRLYLQEPYGFLINPDYVITSSKFTVKSSKFTYGIDEKNILMTGTPKSDLLFSLMHGNSNSFSNEKNLNLNPHGKKLIFFLPTIRPNPMFNLFGYNFDIQDLNLLLNEIDGMMLFNFHPSSVKYPTVPDFSPYENIQLLNYKGDEINKMLCQIDLLITDYSSIFSDFLVFNKPIIFAKFDHENYIKTKGVYVDYDNDLPGPKANNWSEILQYIKTIFMDKKDEYQKERNNLRTLIYPNLDGDACKRITQSVMSLND